MQGHAINQHHNNSCWAGIQTLNSVCRVQREEHFRVWWVQTGVGSFNICGPKCLHVYENIRSLPLEALCQKQRGTTFVINLTLLADESTVLDLWHLDAGSHVLELCCIMWM